MAHDVFISYSTHDKALADAVCAHLEAAQLRCWIAPRDVQPGADWGESIVDAIHGARAMVLIFSSKSNESPQVRREVQRAFEQGLTVIPLRVEQVMPSKALSYYIGPVHWLDAMTPPMEAHLQRLTERVVSLVRATRTDATVGMPPPIPPPVIPSPAIHPTATPISYARAADYAPRARVAGLLTAIVVLLLLPLSVLMFLSDLRMPTVIFGDSASPAPSSALPTFLPDSAPTTVPWSPYDTLSQSLPPGSSVPSGNPLFDESLFTTPSVVPTPPTVESHWLFDHAAFMPNLLRLHVAVLLLGGVGLTMFIWLIARHLRGVQRSTDPAPTPAPHWAVVAVFVPVMSLFVLPLYLAPALTARGWPAPLAWLGSIAWWVLVNLFVLQFVLTCNLTLLWGGTAGYSLWIPTGSMKPYYLAADIVGMLIALLGAALLWSARPRVAR